ncbi:MAG: cytochrome c3 family protein [Anaeromyxobacteraceae bacterium]
MRNILKALVAVAAMVPALAFGDIVNSLHNLSAGSGTNQVCAFCHTPHGANKATTALWNRNLPTTNGSFVWSNVNTVNGTALPASLSDGSLKCLSCHDGSQALGNVINDPGAVKTTLTATLTGTPYDIVTGASNSDLGGNHPVGVPYPAGPAGTYNGIAVNTAITGFKAATTPTSLTGLRLYFNSGAATGALGIECGTCHDPHGVVVGTANIAKFLRKDNAASALCTTCHSK